MISLTQKDLKEFKEAIYKDYGIQVKDSDLYNSAFNFLSFFEAIVKFKNTNKIDKKVLKSFRRVS